MNVKLNADTLKAAADKVAAEKANLEGKQEKKLVKAPIEKREERLAGYVKKSEKDKFLSLIGRKSESDAIRDLVLEFIAKK